MLRGEGALLYRDEGPPLIDAISSWWVTLHGHAHPHVADAIARQAETLEQVIFAEFTHPQAERLADRLAAKTGLERVFFSDNGSTAVEVALKIAIQWWHNKGEPKTADHRLRRRLSRRYVWSDGRRSSQPFQ